MGIWRDTLGQLTAGGATFLVFAAGPSMALLTPAFPVLEVLDHDVERAAVYLPLPEPAAPEPFEEVLAEPEDEGSADETHAPPVPVEELEEDEDPIADEDEGPAEVAGEAEHEASSARKRKRRRRRRCKVDPIPEIEKTARASWVVDRDIVKTYARSIKQLNSLGWTRPHEGDDGKKDGLLVGGVRCNNDLYRAGIRSGDVVHAVNGHKVKSLLQAFFVYNKVRKDEVVQVEISRRGKRRVLTYRILG